MASGWASDGAVNEQIDSTVNDGVARVRQAMGQGESEHYCQECGRSDPGSEATGAERRTLLPCLPDRTGQTAQASQPL